MLQVLASLQFEESADRPGEGAFASRFSNGKEQYVAAVYRYTFQGNTFWKVRGLAPGEILGRVWVSKDRSGCVKNFLAAYKQILEDELCYWKQGVRTTQELLDGLEHTQKEFDDVPSTPIS